jgi:P4 family phage/plasmid primase-like protien
MMSPVTVIPRRDVDGWDGEPDPTTYPVAEVLEALETHFGTDAHFLPYLINGADWIGSCPRINKTVVRPDGQVKGHDAYVRITCAVLDVDDQVGKKLDGRAREEWWTDQQPRLELLPSPDDLGWYRTRGGYRVLWRLDPWVSPAELVPILDRLRAAAAAVGIHADRLRDWGRCYRLPYVERDGARETFDADWSWLDPGSCLDVGGIPAVAPSTRGIAGGGVFSRVGASRAPKAFELPDEVDEGERHLTMVSYAGQLRYRGLSVDEIRAELETANERCDPPLPSPELARIARNMGRYDPGPAVPDTPDPREAVRAYEATQPDEPPLFATGGPGSPDPGAPLFQIGSESELAGVLAADIAPVDGDLVSDMGDLWRWNGRLWRKLSDAAVKTAVCAYDGQWVHKGFKADGSPKLEMISIGDRRCVGVYNIVDRRFRQQGYFAEAPSGVAFSNGFASVDDGEVVVVPPYRDQRCTFGLPWDYVPDAVPTRFLGFLRSLFKDNDDCEEIIELLREWIGEMLLGRSTLHGRMLMLVGEGNNGKSTFLDILAALVPADARVAISPQDMGRPFHRASLSTARLNLVNETPESDIFDATSIKAVATGDTISDSFKYKDVFSFRPRAGHAFACNDLPAVKDNTDGFWRRWLVIAFSRVIPKEERILGLGQLIIDAEIGQIASWALDGAAAMHRRGGQFVVPASCEWAATQWRQDASPVATFLAERTRPSEEDALWSAASALYKAFCRWCDDTGHKPCSATKFGRRVQSCGVSRERRKGGSYYSVSAVVLPFEKRR